MAKDKINAHINSGDDATSKGDAPLVDHSDRWIWGVWIAAALIAVAILPFASRMGDVAQAIASFCGITFS